jgi:hypothetical protein
MVAPRFAPELGAVLFAMRQVFCGKAFEGFAFEEAV